MQICDTNDHVVVAKDFHMKITQPSQLRVPVGGLPEDDYRVLCAVKQAKNLPAVQRTFLLRAYRIVSF